MPLNDYSQAIDALTRFIKTESTDDLNLLNDSFKNIPDLLKVRLIQSAKETIQTNHELSANSAFRLLKTLYPEINNFEIEFTATHYVSLIGALLNTNELKPHEYVKLLHYNYLFRYFKRTF